MIEFREKEKIKKIRVKNCKCVADEVFREKGERKKGKKKKRGRRRAGTFWRLEEVVGIKRGNK